jgi:predicted ribosomally synthesized peptide with nif11-like leader
MSMQNAVAFLDRVSDDTALQSRIQHKDDAIQLGAELNIPFTADELDQAMSERSFSELSAEELQGTAGGFICW